MGIDGGAIDIAPTFSIISIIEAIIYQMDIGLAVFDEAGNAKTGIHAVVFKFARILGYICLCNTSCQILTDSGICIEIVNGRK